MCETLEERDLQLLRNPQGALDEGHGVQLGDQLPSARVAAWVGEHEQAMCWKSALNAFEMTFDAA